MKESIIPIPRASEQLVECLIRWGILEVTESGLRCKDSLGGKRSNFLIVGRENERMGETKEVPVSNIATVTGYVFRSPIFSHEAFGKNFFSLDLFCARPDDRYDRIPIVFSEELLNVSVCREGNFLCVCGQVRTYEKRVESKKQHVMFIYAKDISIVNDISVFGNNRIWLNGYICKEPIYRKMRSGKSIAKFLLAVNRPNGKSDYIHCICWGSDAKRVSRLNVGTNLTINGRWQNRTYKKNLEQGKEEVRIAYEISAFSFDIQI